MPSLTAELLGFVAVVVGLLVTALIVDPDLRARRKLNRQRRTERGSAAAGAAIVLAIVVTGLVVIDAQLGAGQLISTITATLEGVTR